MVKEAKPTGWEGKNHNPAWMGLRGDEGLDLRKEKND